MIDRCVFTLLRVLHSDFPNSDRYFRMTVCKGNLDRNGYFNIFLHRYVVAGNKPCQRNRGHDMVSRGGIDNFHHAGGIYWETGMSVVALAWRLVTSYATAGWNVLFRLTDWRRHVPEVSSNTGRKADSMPVMCTTGCTLTPSR